MMIFKKRVLWFADTTVNIDPTAEELADIAIQTAKSREASWREEPRVAMLSFSNFGSNNHPSAAKVREAVEIVKRRDARSHRSTARCRPTRRVDAGDFERKLSRSTWLRAMPNILIFPDLQSGNIAYKLMARLGMPKRSGRFLSGMNKPVFVLAAELRRERRRQHGRDHGDGNPAPQERREPP